ncbi:hypothetical protein PILCRDRAFT_16355 [Piloderma croceum F 1598]|uniref:F-box domain-containing protein n=1 Tax=Piloderma croceum (strain F 1598) TaxID=765440 RepID=A0A0C3B4I2_PILCF|nr:hypothetical protein PILCRDRAFT_16355 [Piloderma croceum F 1598]
MVWKKQRTIFPSCTDARCPHLRNIQFMEYNKVHGADVLALSTVAPSVEKLEIPSWRLSSTERLALLSGLERWANTLRHVDLNLELTGSGQYPSIDTIFPHLVHLSYLSISSIQLSPTSLRTTTAPLKEIHYSATVIEMEELQWHLVNPDVLPSLEICFLHIFPGLEPLSPKLP